MDLLQQSVLREADGHGLSMRRNARHRGGCDQCLLSCQEQLGYENCHYCWRAATIY